MSHGEVFSIEPAQVHSNAVFVEGAEARHIAKALRHRPGDELRFTTGDGHFLVVRLDRVESSGVHGEILHRESDPREAKAPWMGLGLALLKGDHLDLAVEKAVELGVHEIWLTSADHCVVQWKRASVEKKLARMARVAESAMKQSGRSWRPTLRLVEGPLAALRGFREQYGETADVLVADEAPQASPLPAIDAPPRPRLALVGPEGGFSSREKSDLDAAGATAFTLGPFRLRAETAAMAAVYTLQQGLQPGRAK